MIWDLIEQTGFNRHFSDPSTTITTLLLDQNIITQLKNQNPQLLEYLQQRKHQFMVELVTYTITMPQESQGHDRCHRLPYISSELLAIDSELIYSEFFREGQKEEENEYWQLLLKFLDSKAATNQILMGYFEKVVNNLYAGNKMKTAVIVSCNLDRFVRLLPNGSIADILKQCIVILNVPEGVVLAQRTEIMHRVASMLIDSPSEEIRKVCGDVLGEIVNKFQAFSSGDALIEDLLGSPTLLKIYEIQTSEAVNTFLICLLKKTQQRTINQKDESVPLLALPQLHKTGIEQYLIREGENIRNISKSPGFIINQNQQTVRKSNRAMYSLLSLLGIALQEGIGGFVNEGLITFCWNLALLYPYNNILHVLIKTIFMGILNSEAIRPILLNNYETQVLSLCRQHLILLRPFVYEFWRQAKKYKQVTTDPGVLSDFSQLVEETLEPMVKYEVKEVHQHHPQMKLIVDEEDKAAPVDIGSRQVEEEIVDIEKISEQMKDEKEMMQASSEFQQFTIEQAKKEQKEGEEEKREKLQLDFFGAFPVQSHPPVAVPPKKDLFDNFGDFF